VSLNDENARRECLLKYLDNTLAPAERRLVEALLVEDVDVRNQLRELALQAVVIADCERVGSRADSGLPRRSVVRRSWFGGAWFGGAWFGGAQRVWQAAPWTIAMCACVTLVWMEFQSGAELAIPTASIAEPLVRVAEVRFLREATLVELTASHQQQQPEPIVQGRRLALGLYRLQRGFAELDFFGGAVLALEGPADLELISQQEARLLSGRVTVDAGDTTTSFLLHTPVGEVLDIGTRYGVYVGASGVTETHVFEGLVDIRQTTDDRSARPARRVTADSAVRLTTAGLAESFPVSESAFPQPSRRISNLLRQADFEPGTQLQVGQSALGQWGGDICRVVGITQGIRPLSGEGMLLFQSTSQSPAGDGRSSATAASQLSQWIDLTPYRAAIDGGRVRAKLTARFNRVAGDDRTDSQFSIHLESFGVAPAEAMRLRKSQPVKARSRISYDLLSDSDPASWETVEAVLALPPNALFLEATVFAFENVSNDQDATPEFDGHFADHLQFELLVDPAGSESSGQQVREPVTDIR